MFETQTNVSKSVPRSRAATGATLLSLLAVISCWELAVRAFGMPTYVVPSPLEVVSALITEFPTLLPHIGVTLFAWFVGLLTGAAIGFALAVIVSPPSLAERIVTALAVAVMVMSSCLGPLYLIAFLGLGATAPIVEIALVTGPIMLIMCAAGLRQADPVESARLRESGASGFQLLFDQKIPAALPMMSVGLMIAAILGLVTAVVGGMANSEAGLGFMYVKYAQMMMTPQAHACVLIVVILCISIYLLFTSLEETWVRCINDRRRRNDGPRDA
ncbi:MAG: ABC transporter permease [Geminicoccaceae bacterium]